ncbi:glycine amidinotransferase [Actinacidiphila acididurans]|uniref:Glycine amidinotransferase n=1 Tax=Actinacidiphila acididurans TaxID=2784346 RepID=A0ABS2TV79_9ACTN|nr:glycine amidinotransferase [Actinacidiphila acididurans]MBM9506411.1 glycine amidinotransferase [Actinacidiphila acididurans]
MLLNSYDSWSPLREVVLGSADNYTSHERELSFDLFFHDETPYSRIYYPRHATRGADDTKKRSPIKQRYVEELREDVEQMAEIFTQLNITVHRPLPLDAATGEIRTPVFDATVIPPLNVRDNSIVFGDEIIETPPLVRSRYFETQFLKPVYAEYFRRGARWTVMPRPLMTDASFDLSYVADAAKPGSLIEQVTDPQPSPYDTGFEMMIDGAQCLRLGRDVFVNVSNANHALGFDWLERHLAGRFRVHRLHRLADSHIDSSVLALRPGLLLVRSTDVAEKLPKALRRWDMIFPPEPQDNNFPDYDDDDLVLTSRYIDLNVLSLSPDTVMVNAACPELIQTLEKRGFTVVPVRHRHRRLFGGGLHCFTLDTVREGSAPEDYLED